MHKQNSSAVHVYGSTKKYILKELDPIHHQGLRIALDAFRTSPVQSLYAEAGKPSLEHRRLKLSMKYYLKINSLSDNPCYSLINDPPPPELFERSKTLSPRFFFFCKKKSQILRPKRKILQAERGKFCENFAMLLHSLISFSAMKILQTYTHKALSLSK